VADATGAAITNTQAQTAVNAVRAFWEAVKSYLPDEIVLTVQPTVDIYRETDGELIASTLAATPPSSVTGTSTSAYSMAAGIKVNLVTGVIRNGRRVRGAIFIVPAGSNAMTSTGSVASGTRTAVNAAGSTLISTLAGGGMNMIVFNRPGADPVTKPGDRQIVANLETNEKTAILRGRRD
jgi:acetyl esterase/lipase